MIKKIINKIKSTKKAIKIVYLISIIAIILDQLTKIIVMNNLDIGKEIVVIPNFFSLMYITNTGAAFSSLRNHTTLLIIITIFCIALINSMITKENYKYKLSVLSLGILFGGMIGNLIDRVFYKNVIDFLAFTLINYKAPVFNVADICITCGVIIYIAINIYDEIIEKKNNTCYNKQQEKSKGKTIHKKGDKYDKSRRSR